MTREDMLKNMLRRYESCLDSSRGEDDMVIMDNLLHEVEEAGMLPPNDRYTNSDDDYLLKHYNKWESTNE